MLRLSRAWASFDHLLTTVSSRALATAFFQSSLRMTLIDVNNLGFEHLSLAHEELKNQTIDSLELGYAARFLEGTLISGGTEAVVAVGGGIGLDVVLSAQSAEQLPHPGEPVRLWTHLAVREDNWSLYGFVGADERAMFRLLISVSGVGPKVALGLLSRAKADEIASYLRTGDEKSLTGLPGIGKKSAARLVVELGQRVPELQNVAASGGAATGPGSGLAEAMAVLGAMGLPPARAEQALVKARGENPDLASDLEAWVRVALQQL